jgi:UDP-3-O-[3-hydroxymyristoyl] glucosamine N-acyltransferase
VLLAALAAALALPVEGDGSVAIDGVASLEDAGPRELAFATGPKYQAAFAASRAGAFLLPEVFDAQGRACLRSKVPYADFARAIDLFHPRPLPAPGVHPSAVVAVDLVLGAGVSIGALSVVGERVRIGARSVLHPHVTVYPDVEIGEDCVIHSGVQLRDGTRLGNRVVLQNGVVIGSPGFGYTNRADGSRVHIPHVCGVELGDDVELGANCTIDASHPGHGRRGHPDVRTRIGVGVKMDNGVQIAHGCEIGDHAMLCAHVALAGSTKVGKYVFMGGMAASAGHLTIGDFAMVGAMAAPSSDIAPGAQVLGVPAVDRRLWGKVVAAKKRLPELIHRVRRIEKKLGLDGEG